MAKSAQPYSNSTHASILGTSPDEYSLSVEEYYRIYSFYVTFSICKSCSAKKKTFIDYGWASNNVSDTAIYAALMGVLNLNRNPNFVFTDKDDLESRFNKADLPDGSVTNLEFERAVIGNTYEISNYHKLFNHIRNGFAHGRFKLRYSNANEKMIVFQDNDRYNITARMVLRLNTLLRFIETIDLNGLI